MSKGKLPEDVDELFVQKPTWTSVTKTVAIESPEFMMKIEKKENVESPRFKLAGIEFYIRVKTGDYCYNGTEYIGVGLINCSKEDQTTSVTFTEESGAQESWQRKTIKAWWGSVKFLSHENYEAWARDHGDVFKLKVKITLHKKVNTAEDGWIR